jgi:predicted Fe-S protein YdhL (DUF1289 family)
MDPNEIVSKSSQKWYCSSCDYGTSKKSNWVKHINTKKHNILINTNETVEKGSKEWYCSSCDYKTYKKSHWKKHINTKKHTLLTNPNEKVTKKYACVCGKEYKHASTLCAHKKKCEATKNELIVLDKNVHTNDIIKSSELQDIIQTISTTKTMNGEKPVININVNMNIHNGDNINKYEHVETKANTVTNTNTLNNNNKTFSVTNYLNTECKDAYTIEEVANKYKCDVLKLPKNTNNFYKHIVDTAFKDIPTEKLPIRCSDVKRKTFYTKKKEWTKDNGVCKDFAMKLIDVICEERRQYILRNPNYHDNDIISDILHALLKNIVKVYDEKTVKHIVSYIADKVKIIKSE